MRIVFMGTPEFAAVSLQRLFDDGFDVRAVFTQPDRPAGRGKKISFSPVKAFAQGRCPVYQPYSLRDGTALKLLSDISPDIIVAVAYGKLLPIEILELPAYGCINIHGSLLPKYRGAAPIQRAVLGGEKVTGVTAMYLSEKMDEGDIIAQSATEIYERENSGELFVRLSALGAELLSETLTAIENGTARRSPQDNAEATYAPALTKECSPIDWKRDAAEIVNHIRGLNPWPVATADFSGTNLKVFAAVISDNNTRAEPGTVLSADKRGITVVCGDRAVTITEISAPGGKRMAVDDYLRGHPLQC